MDLKLLEDYASLIVKVGINLQKGQYVIIKVEPELEDFAAIVTKQCYLNGAKHVYIEYTSAKINKVAMTYSSVEDLSTVNAYDEARFKFRVDENPALIWLDGDDPDGKKGIDPIKSATVNRNRMSKMLKYIEAINNKYQWCIAGVPSKRWAKKVFPSLSEEEAVEALWSAILKTSRADDFNAVENWNKHSAELKNRCKYLNSLNLKSLHYTSKKGTDLTVGLIPGVKFDGGSETTLTGIVIQPNIPTEECFTSPKKGEAEGIVYASKPLVYQGQMIEDFSVRFEKGKAVEVNARVGKEVLESILSLDEGASYLGECALVPFNSPINNIGILFYNTLFDENAACHLALGKGFTNLYPGYENMSDEEIYSKGINKSSSHVDFMIGDNTLNIVGTTVDGKEIQIFKDGEWAFSI